MLVSRLEISVPKIPKATLGPLFFSAVLAGLGRAEPESRSEPAVPLVFAVEPPSDFAKVDSGLGTFSLVSFHIGDPRLIIALSLDFQISVILIEDVKIPPLTSSIELAFE